MIDYEASRARYAGKSEFLIASYHLCGNTARTAMHRSSRHRGGADLASVPIERLVHVPVVLIDATAAPSGALGPELFTEHHRRGRAPRSGAGRVRARGCSAVHGCTVRTRE